MEPGLQMFALLLAAHILGDFSLQTNGMVRRKREPAVAFLHFILHGVLAYGIVQAWITGWWLVPLVFLLHGLTDVAKLEVERYIKRPGTIFAWDQLAHVVGAALIAWLGTSLGLIDLEVWQPYYAQVFVLLGGFVLTVWGVGFFIGACLEGMIGDDEDLVAYLRNGLAEGGARIGQLERALIFILVMVNQAPAIGFVIAAKSILRFKEAESQKIAEYILVGTFWSFGLGIGFAWLTIQSFILLS